MDHQTLCEVFIIKSISKTEADKVTSIKKPKTFNVCHLHGIPPMFWYCLNTKRTNSSTENVTACLVQ